MSVKLSILDQAPISDGQTNKEALEMAIDLAKLGDKLGYERYWIAEHHAFIGFASPQPGIMLARIGAETERIRIGSGATLLPYYKPLNVAESFNLLQSLYPDRVDIGLGRAPGGSAEVSIALSDNYLKKVREFEDDIELLLQFLHQSFPKEHTFSKIAPMPLPDNPPDVWILGTSEKSAELAAKQGLPYCFGAFMSNSDGEKIVQTYRENFNSSHKTFPKTIVAVNVVCAETEKDAEHLAQSQLIWKLKQEKYLTEERLPSLIEADNYQLNQQEKEKIEQMKSNIIIGNPEAVFNRLKDIEESYQTDEIMILSLIHDKQAKLKSYQLIKQYEQEMA